MNLLLPLMLAQAPAVAFPPEQVAHLSAVMRDWARAQLPAPLGETQRRWGQQREVVVGLKWRGLRPEPQRDLRNDGLWQKVRLDSIDPIRSFSFALTSLASAGPNEVAFEAMAGLDCRATLEQQAWKSGVRLYSGESRSRFRGALRLKGTVLHRTESRGAILPPDIVLTVKVTEAEVFYQNLVVEHTLGLDGRPAEKLGEAAHTLLMAVKPSLERRALEKANDAVKRAADSREVRLGLGQLFGGK